MGNLRHFSSQNRRDWKDRWQGPTPLRVAGTKAGKDCGQRLCAGPGGAGSAPQRPPAPPAAAPGGRGPPPAPRGRSAGTVRPLPPDPARARSFHSGVHRARPRLADGSGGTDPTAAGSGVPRPRLTPCLACSSASRCCRSASNSSSAMAEGGRQALRLRHRCQCAAERGAWWGGPGSRVGPPWRPPGPGKSGSAGGCEPSRGSFSVGGCSRRSPTRRNGSLSRYWRLRAGRSSSRGKKNSRWAEGWSFSRLPWAALPELLVSELMSLRPVRLVNPHAVQFL